MDFKLEARTGKDLELVTRRLINCKNGGCASTRTTTTKT